MATIVHFDISADNPDRAKEFYEKLFHWKFTFLPDPMNYYLIETTDLKNQKGIGGGMAKRENEEQKEMVNFIGAGSIDESIVLSQKLGAKIIQDKQAVPGYGYLAVCIDTENNLFGLFQR